MRIGRRALYRKADTLKWAAETGRTVENTAQFHEGVAMPEGGAEAGELLKAREPEAVAKAQAMRAKRSAATVAAGQ